LFIMNKPLVPEDLRSRVRPGKYLERACVASAKHALVPYSGISLEQTVRGLWPEGADVTLAVLKGATNPATTTTSGWASQLAGSAVNDFVASLTPLSAAAKLFEVAPRASLAGVNTLAIPYRSGAISASAVPWVGEGQPIPVGQFTTTSATLGPAHKLAVLAGMTRELAEHGSGEAVLTQMLRENAALALDASLFSNAAATADRPAGLLAGITPLTAATAGDSAMDTDLAALANVIADDGIGLAYVAHPAQAAAIKLRRGSMFPTDIQVWASLGVSEGTVIALDPAAVVSAFGAEPEIASSMEAIIHMETTPQPISSTGSPNTAAAPVRSMFQTDCVAIRLVLRAAWILRAPGAIAWVQNVNW
jgi:capsid protein